MFNPFCLLELQVFHKLVFYSDLKISLFSGREKTEFLKNFTVVKSLSKLRWFYRLKERMFVLLEFNNYQILTLNLF